MSRLSAKTEDKIKTTAPKVIKKGRDNAAKAAIRRLEHRTSAPAVASQTGRSGNPRKQFTPEAWKQAEGAFDIHTILDTVGFVPVIGESAMIIIN